MSGTVTVSIVSHGQNKLVNELLGDIERQCEGPLPLVVTENIYDAHPLSVPKVHSMRHIMNDKPKGFGANHNAAFSHCRTPFFCVVNPDVRLNADPFPELLPMLEDRAVGAAGPLIRGSGGSIEDSARRFPTPLSLIKKLFRPSEGPDYSIEDRPVAVDWIAGMFMLFRRETYELLGGFDERYFLYYEDVDLCRRLRNRGFSIIYNPRIEVTHHARRGSHRNPRLALQHLKSMARFFLS